MRFLLLLSALAACTPSPYRLGVRAANDGRYIDASQQWLVALDADTLAVKPRRALREHARDAWREHLHIAREHEASGRFEQAVAAYDATLAFADELNAFELLTFSTADAIAERQATLERWASQQHELGRGAHQEGRWADAVAFFDKARELQPDRRGLNRDQGASYAAWAEADLQHHRYHDAAEHFRAAYRLTGARSFDAWAASVEVGLGRYALLKRACRAATEHFERAGDVVGDPNLVRDLAAARSCARTGLIVEPVQQAVSIEQGDLALGEMLLDRMQRELEVQGSRYIRILDPRLLDSTPDLPERRILITLRINQASVSDAASSSSRQRIEGQRLEPCDQEVLLYSPDEVCTAPADIEFQLHRTAQTVRLAGSAQVVELTTSQSHTRPIEVQLTHDVTHASDFEMIEAGVATPIRVGTSVGPGRVEVPAEIVALDRQPEVLPTAEEMLVDAIRSLAEESAAAVLEAIDHEPALAPPRRLTLLTPTAEPAPAPAPPVPTTAPVALPGVEAPPASDEAPAASDEAPPASDEAPAASDEAPAASDEAPAASDEAPPASDEAPIDEVAPDGEDPDLR